MSEKVNDYVYQGALRLSVSARALYNCTGDEHTDIRAGLLGKLALKLLTTTVHFAKYVVLYSGGGVSEMIHCNA